MWTGNKSGSPPSMSWAFDERAAVKNAKEIRWMSHVRRMLAIHYRHHSVLRARSVPSVMFRTKPAAQEKVAVNNIPCTILTRYSGHSRSPSSQDSEQRHSMKGWTLPKKAQREGEFHSLEWQHSLKEQLMEETSPKIIWKLRPWSRHKRMFLSSGQISNLQYQEEAIS